MCCLQGESARSSQRLAGTNTELTFNLVLSRESPIMKPITLIFTACLSLMVFGAVLATSPADHHEDNAAGAAKDERKPLTMNVYALDTCPISGQKLGSMGDPVVKEYEHDGEKREVRFCCPPCIERFEDEKAEHFGAIDEKLIEQQKAHYPLDACIVSGRKLEESDTVFDKIHEGRLVRFCCPGCPQRFKADPDRYMTRLDEAIIKQQRESYPLESCVVAGSELGSMGEPDEVIVGGTLVRFCCAGCRGGFKDDPAKHLATIREAWREQHESARGDED